MPILKIVPSFLRAWQKGKNNSTPILKFVNFSRVQADKYKKIRYMICPKRKVDEPNIKTHTKGNEMDKKLASYGVC